MFWSRYPYTDMSNLNLDWVIEILKEMDKRLDDFVATNSIKYANPFQWNITSQYEKNTLTIDAQSGIAYLSVQAVPSGVSITNISYWTPVFDLSAILNNFSSNLTINDEHDNSTSSANYAVGEWILWHDLLYKVIAPISVGNGFAVGTNIVRITIESVISDINTLIYNVNNRINGIDQQIADLKLRSDDFDNVIYVGDSYGDLMPYSWWQLVNAYLGINTFYKTCIGGSGFATTFGGNSFLQNLQALTPSVNDPDTIRHIVVVGGINDCVGSPNMSDIENAMIAFNSYVKATFKNAKIHLAFVGTQSVNSTDQYQRSGKIIREVIKTYISTAGMLGWHYLTNAEYIMKNYRLLDYDGLHPVLNGTTEIGKQISLGLVSGSCDVHYKIECTGMTDTPLTGVTKVTTADVIKTIYIDNDTATIELNGNCYNPGSYTESTSLMNARELTQIDGVCPVLTCDENLAVTFEVPALITLTDSGVTWFEQFPLVLQIKNGRLATLTAPELNKDHTSFGSGVISNIDWTYGRCTCNTNLL